ncbi:hypothetical protein D0B88_13290 [Cellvibrio sp. KY-YJ-3]|nr:hypothetical protein D0B88_13290 [Cellvibrio sp. KY-YJ-3]
MEQSYDPFQLFNRSPVAITKPQLLEALLIGVGKAVVTGPLYKQSGPFSFEQIILELNQLLS